MQQITLRLDPNTIESLEEEADEQGVSRSEYIRDVIETRHEADELRAEHEREVRELRSEHEQEVSELEEQIDKLERELEVTENKLQEAREQMKHREQMEEKVDTLAKHVEEQEEITAAPFFVRWAKWWRSRGEA